MSRAKIIYGRKNRYFADDREVTREEFDRIFPNRIEDLLSGSGETPDGHRPACWPMKSDLSCIVHPDQVNEAAATARAAGVATDFVRDPRSGMYSPVFTDQKHRRDYAEQVMGMVDRNGSYGDPSRSRLERRG